MSNQKDTEEHKLAGKKNFDALFEIAEENSADFSSPSYNSLCDEKERYQHAELIATGGMKSIYKVYDFHTKKFIAMAKLHEDADKELYDPFIHEGWLTALLDHPNIIKIHDVGLDQSLCPFFTMDLKSGKNLADVLKILIKKDSEAEKNYSLDILLEIFLKVCDAISYAHSKKILHLDLKPENIQVGDYGEVIVCDWGLGKLLGDHQGTEFDKEFINADILNNVTLHGHIKGTPGYMAPEQILQNEDKSPETDIYGLGGILYSILTLKQPLQGEIEEVLKKTVTGEIASPLDSAPERHISKSIAAVVSKAMAVDKNERYNSVRDLRNDITKFLSGYSTQAEEAGLWKEFLFFYKRNKSVCQIILLSLLSIIILSSFYLKSINEKKNEAEQNLVLANEQKLKAENALKKYLDEKKTSDKIGKNLIDNIQQKYEILIGTDQFIQFPHSLVENIIEELDLSLSVDSDNEALWKEKAYWSFISLDFETFKKCSYKPEDLSILVNSFPKVEAHNFLDFFQMTKKETANPVLLELILTYNTTNKSPFKLNADQRLHCIKLMLETLNPEWESNSKNIIYKDSEIKLKGSKLTRVANSHIGNRCLLRFIVLLKVVLKDSGIYDLRHFSGMKLQQIDARGSSVKNLNNCRRLFNVKSLLIDKGRYRPRDIQRNKEAFNGKIIER